MNKIQNRLESKGVWLGILAQVLLILTFVLTPEEITAIKIIVGAILEGLTILGILNNPTNKNGF